MKTLFPFLNAKIHQTTEIQGVDKIYCRPGTLLEYCSEQTFDPWKYHSRNITFRNGYSASSVGVAGPKTGDIVMVLNESGIIQNGHDLFTVVKILFNDRTIYVHILYPEYSMINFFSIKLHGTM